MRFAARISVRFAGASCYDPTDFCALQIDEIAPTDQTNIDHVFNVMKAMCSSYVCRLVYNLLGWDHTA